MYAIVATGGKQYLVKEGDTINVDKPEEVKEVLLLSDDSGIKIGTPVVPGVIISSEVVSSGLGPKIRIAKFKAKSRYRKVMGFRAKVTKLRITKIGEVASESKKVIIKKINVNSSKKKI